MLMAANAMIAAVGITVGFFRASQARRRAAGDLAREDRLVSNLPRGGPRILDDRRRSGGDRWLPSARDGIVRSHGAGCPRLAPVFPGGLGGDLSWSCGGKFNGIVTRVRGR
jgi:hypothetical protein